MGATGRAVAAEFRRLTDGGTTLHVAGSLHRRPAELLRRGYTPRHRIDLFGVRYYLANVRQNEDIRFFPAYVALPRGRSERFEVYARIFYKDVSLVWRSASHFVRTDGENWIGKGDIQVVERDGHLFNESAEHTSELPFEIQTALESTCRAVRRIPYDDRVVELVLRHGAHGRIAAFSDFTAPRRRARSDPRNLVRGGRPIARFTRAGDPTSLRFARGYEPDFRSGVLERATGTSRLYHGRLVRHRIVSTNRRVQFLFFSGPKHTWMAHPQATTTEITSYGVRSIDVEAPEDAFVPGYEYHFLDECEEPPVFVSQIPKGWAGAPSHVDASRADASAWLDRLPVVREYRRHVLGRAGGD